MRFAPTDSSSPRRPVFLPADAGRPLWRRIYDVGPRGWLLLAEAQVWLLWARLVLLLRPRGRLVVAGADPIAQRSRNPAHPAEADRMALAVNRVARYGLLRATCLVRALALHRMLESHGITGARVRFGVRRNTERFESHAWVEWDQRVVGDDPKHVRTFTPLDDLSLALTSPTP